MRLCPPQRFAHSRPCLLFPAGALVYNAVRILCGDSMQHERPAQTLITEAVPEPSVLSHAALLYNPAAGSGRLRRHRLEEARAILKRARIETSLLATAAPGHATDLARQCAAEGCRLVIVSGGDGTINEVVNGLAGSSTAMAVLPCGTANVLAKELRIPWDVRRAAELVPR